ALMNAPRYATSDYTQLFLEEMNRRTNDVPAVQTRFSIVSPGFSFAIWALEDWAARDESQAEIQQMIQARINTVPGLQSFVFAPPSLPGAGGGLPISYVVQSTGPPDQVFEVAEEIRLAAQQSGRFIIVQNSMSYDLPQV